MKRTQATTVALLVTMIGAACTKTDSTADSKKTKTKSELTTDSGTSSDPNKNVVATVGKTKITEAQALADYAILAKLSNAASAGQAGAKKLDPKKPTHELLLSTVSQLATAEALKLSLKTRKGSITAKDRADAVKQLDSQLAQSPGVKLPADYKKRLLEQYAIETAVLRTFKLDDVSLQAEYKKNPPKAVTCAPPARRHGSRSNRGAQIHFRRCEIRGRCEARVERHWKWPTGWRPGVCRHFGVRSGIRGRS